MREKQRVSERERERPAAVARVDQAGPVSCPHVACLKGSGFRVCVSGSCSFGHRARIHPGPRNIHCPLSGREIVPSTFPAPGVRGSGLVSGARVFFLVFHVSRFPGSGSCFFWCPYPHMFGYGPETFAVHRVVHARPFGGVSRKSIFKRFFNFWP